jgi:uncharacterized membrane protein
VEKLKAVWANVRDNLWFLPTIFTIGSALLALLVVRFNDELLDATGIDATDYWWLFGGGSEAARSILEIIAGSIITVTGVVFSVTIIALQLTSTQFTPRVLRTFTADRGNQLVLSVFIGTFTYTLLVQRAVRTSNNGDDGFVPEIAITMAIISAIVSIGFLIYFIAHTARSIQVSVIIDNVTHDTRRVTERIFEREEKEVRKRQRQQRADGANGSSVVSEDRDGSADGEPAIVGTDVAGYVQAINEGTLLDIADEHDLHIVIKQGNGDFVLPGQPLLLVWPYASLDDRMRRKLRHAFHLGLERTPHQDAELGLIELVDIAIKAMSPSINDPTTAITVLDRLAELLVGFGCRPALGCERLNDAGRVCLVVRRPSFQAALELTFDQIRQHSADNPTVMVKLLNRLGEVGALSLPEHRPAVLDALDTALLHAQRAIEEPADRAKVERAAREARQRISQAADHR